MNSRQLVHNYFDRAARRFDAIYDAEKPMARRLAERLFRRVVVERFHLICTLAPCGKEWTVLDVGCGPGRYMMALAQAGAARVVGVDISASMIELARQKIVRAGLGDRCEFSLTPFAEFRDDELFDVVVATGYFDYLENPLADLTRMVRYCRGRILASFPKRWELRVPIRKVRFLLARGFVRFYNRGEVLGLFEAAGVGLDRLALVDLGRDWIAVARVP